MCAALMSQVYQSCVCKETNVCHTCTCTCACACAICRVHMRVISTPEIWDVQPASNLHAPRDFAAARSRLRRPDPRGPKRVHRKVRLLLRPPGQAKAGCSEEAGVSAGRVGWVRGSGALRVGAEIWVPCETCICIVLCCCEGPRTLSKTPRVAYTCLAHTHISVCGLAGWTLQVGCVYPRVDAWVVHASHPTSTSCALGSIC